MVLLPPQWVPLPYTPFPQAREHAQPASRMRSPAFCKPPSSLCPKQSSELQRVTSEPYQPLSLWAWLTGEPLSPCAPWSFCTKQQQLNSLMQMDGEQRSQLFLSDCTTRLMRRQCESIHSLSVTISDLFPPCAASFDGVVLQEHCKGWCLFTHTKPQHHMCIYSWNGECCALNHHACMAWAAAVDGRVNGCPQEEQKVVSRSPALALKVECVVEETL